VSGAALPDARLRGAAVAVVSGSGLAVVPEGVVVEDEIGYGRLGWPVTQVTGHPSRLLFGRWQGDGPLVLLACGRPHLYEGWSSDELERPVGDLARWGVRRLVLTNASGGLAAGLDAGTLLVVDEVVDLQTAPHDEPVRLAATAAGLCTAACQALGWQAPVSRGRYVAVAGPQYETPAEAAWLAGLGDAVGMSAAPELRAAARHALETVVVSCIVNRSGEPVGHADVVTAGGRLAGALAPALGALLTACWPDVLAVSHRSRDAS
jgi:purine-nucleoside phosphorylase